VREQAIGAPAPGAAGVRDRVVVDRRRSGLRRMKRPPVSVGSVRTLPGYGRRAPVAAVARRA
jgi:hypothetical protein